jgi:hypothetical protein
MPGDEGVPNRQGFDYFSGFLSQHHAHNHYPDHLWRNEQQVALPNGVMPVGTNGGGYAIRPASLAGSSSLKCSVKNVSINSTAKP